MILKMFMFFFHVYSQIKKAYQAAYKVIEINKINFFPKFVLKLRHFLTGSLLWRLKKFIGKFVTQSRDLLTRWHSGFS